MSCRAEGWMPLLPRLRSPGITWRVALAALVVPSPLPAGDGGDDPCALQYKAPSYDRRGFAQGASGFCVAQDRPWPYVITPRVILLRPIDADYRWSVSGSIAGRFGDRESMAVLGLRLHWAAIRTTKVITPGVSLGLGPDLVLAHD